MSQTYTIATRGSKLALWQSQHVQELLNQQGVHTSLKIVKTQGDKVQDRFLHDLGGKGAFIRELESAMARGEADLAVHSLKDLPAVIPQGFVLAAVLPRHSPYDVLVGDPGKDFPLINQPSDLPINIEDIKAAGSITVATASLRRQSLIKEASDTIKLQAVRGNVDTRLNKLCQGPWQGLILAEAAFERLEIQDYPKRRLDPQWFVPSPAQGALAIECRHDHPLRSVLSSLEDPGTRAAVDAERQLLADLGGDCTMPIGCHISPIDQNSCQGSAVVMDYSGNSARGHCHFSVALQELQPTQAAELLMEQLKTDGVNQILKSLADTKPDMGEL